MNVPILPSVPRESWTEMSQKRSKIATTKDESLQSRFRFVTISLSRGDWRSSGLDVQDDRDWKASGIEPNS